MPYSFIFAVKNRFWTKDIINRYFFFSMLSLNHYAQMLHKTTFKVYPNMYTTVMVSHTGSVCTGAWVFTVSIIRQLCTLKRMQHKTLKSTQVLKINLTPQSWCVVIILSRKKTNFIKSSFSRVLFEICWHLQFWLTI